MHVPATGVACEESSLHTGKDGIAPGPLRTSSIILSAYGEGLGWVGGVNGMILRVRTRRGDAYAVLPRKRSLFTSQGISYPPGHARLKRSAFGG